MGSFFVKIRCLDSRNMGGHGCDIEVQVWIQCDPVLLS